MRNRKNKTKNESISTNETHTHNEKIKNKKNLYSKFISLPIINNNLSFNDRNQLIFHKKKSFEGFKPKEDKKPRIKIELKANNNPLNIKYLSLDQRKNNDNILFLLKQMKKKEKNNKKFNQIFSKEIFDYSFNVNDSLLLSKNFYKINGKGTEKNTEFKINKLSKTPKRLKNILINELNLTFNNINKNINIKNNKIKENYYYSNVKTENNINEKNKNHKLIIHNIFFEWTNNKMYDKYLDDFINNKNKKLNNSFDLSISLLNNSMKIKTKKNKKIKSEDLKSKTKINFNKKDNSEENENYIKQKFFDILKRFKLINKENLDINYINKSSDENLLDTLSKNNYNNSLKNIYNFNTYNLDSDNNTKLKKEINKKIKNNESSKSKLNEYNEDISFTRFINIKNNEKKKEKENGDIINIINTCNKTNKSVKLENKLNMSVLNYKKNLNELNQINKFREKAKIFDYKWKKQNNNVNNDLSLLNKDNNIMENNINKKF